MASEHQRPGLSRTRAVGLGVLWLFLAFRPYAAESLVPASRDFLVRTWEQEDGLPHYSLTSVTQSRDGFIWFGSFGGAGRFDGRFFRSFNPGNTPAIKSPAVLKTFVDQEGVLWVGMPGHAACFRAGGWEVFGSKEGVPGGLVRSFAHDSDGNLLLADQSQIARFDRASGKFVSFPTPAPHGQSSIILERAGGRLFAKGEDFFAEFSQGRWNLLLGTNQLGSETIVGLAAARDGGIWLGDGHTIRKWKNGAFVETFPRPAAFSGDAVTLFEDSEGILWMGCYTKGVAGRRPDGSIIRCTTEDGLENNSTTALFEDRDGNIWIASNGGGLARLRPRVFSVIDEKSGLSQRVVNTVAEIAPGQVLAGTHGGGISRIEGERAVPITLTGNEKLSRQSWVQSLLVNNPNDFWAGTYNEGLFHVVNGAAEQIRFHHINARIVNALLKDSRDRLWIGTPAGLVLKEGEQFTIMRPTNGIPHMVVFGMAEDTSGRIWVASPDRGLFVGINTNFETFQFERGKTFEPASAVAAGKDGSVWAGTLAGSLGRIRGDKRYVFTGCHGLPELGITAILEDDQENLWLATLAGIIRVTRKSIEDVEAGLAQNLECVVFDKEDGMRSALCREAFQPTACKLSDGNLCFATLKGLVTVNPHHAFKPPLPPSVSIDEISLDGWSVPLTNVSQGILKAPPGTRRVLVRFTSAELNHPDQLAFRTVWETGEKSWTDHGAVRESQFHDLHPGEYTFRVKAALQRNFDRTPEVRLRVIVQPLYWQTEWFKALVILGAVGGTTGSIWRFHNGRLRRERKQHEHERALAEERARSAALADAKDAADSANRAKSAFLAMVSHEIRTPLNGVIGFADLLTESALNARQQQYTGAIRTSAATLLAIINEILDFSKIEANKLVLEKRPIDPAEIASEIVAMLQPRANEKNLTLRLILADQLPKVVLGDRTRVSQVLLNLIGNALKFTERGSVEVRVDASPGSPGTMMFRFTVTDTGIGIAEEAQSKIFQRFTQADGSMTRRYGGTGLGLTICKELAELMGGSIHFQSKSGHGSTFKFTFPAELVQTPRDAGRSLPTPLESPALPPSAPEGISSKPRPCVLVVEDVAVNLLLALEFLRQLECDVDTAGTGREAVQKWQHKKFDLLLMDCQMPEMDGYEAAREIRRLEAGAPRVPIVAMTANAFPEARERCLAAGMDDYIAKPFHREDLAVVLDRWVRKTSPPA